MNRAETMNKGMDGIEALANVDIPSLKEKVSDEEWKIRVDLAAAPMIEELADRRRNIVAL